MECIIDLDNSNCSSHLCINFIKIVSKKNYKHCVIWFLYFENHKWNRPILGSNKVIIKPINLADKEIDNIDIVVHQLIINSFISNRLLKKL